MMLVKDFIRKYGNNPKFVVGFSVVHNKQIYSPNPKHWHVNEILSEDAVIQSHEGETDITKKIYLPDFLNEWYVEY